MNNDGVPELIIAHVEGGIEILSRSVNTSSISSELSSIDSDILVSPNPFKDVLSLQSLKNENFDWVIYNVNGKVMASNIDSHIYVKDILLEYTFWK